MTVTLAEWLSRRVPAAPLPLALRLVQLVEGFAGSDPARECVEAAVAALRRALDGTPLPRERVLDLLAVDALVTYAFEAASPERLREAAIFALRQVSGVAQKLAAGSHG